VLRNHVLRDDVREAIQSSAAKDLRKFMQGKYTIPKNTKQNSQNTKTKTSHQTGERCLSLCLSLSSSSSSS
jgi:hypothetical protein